MYRFCALRCLLVLSIALVSFFGNGQTATFGNDYSLTRLSAEDGFISSEIYSVIQDKQGFIWFGTAENGVMRYDGRKVDLFEFDSTKSNGLSHNDAGNLMLDREGNVWIGTWGGGANRYDPRTGKFESFSFDANRSDSISANRIQSLHHDLDGSIWLGSYDKGLNRYLGNNRFEHILKTTIEKAGLTHNRIWDIENNDLESLWVATSYGLNLFDKKNNTFQYFFPDPDNPTATGANEIRHILKTKSNELFIGTQLGPFLFEPKTGIFTPILSESGTFLGQVNSMIEDHDGLIWFVTSIGVFRYSKAKGLVEQLALDFNNGFRIIFEDKNRTIWITNEVQGILKLVPRRQFKSIQSAALTPPNAIVADKMGNILIANSTSEIFRWDVTKQQLESLSVDASQSNRVEITNPLLERAVLFLDEDNTLWIAQDASLSTFNLDTKVLKHLNYPRDALGFSQFREIRALSKDRHGNVWIGTYKSGLYLYKPDEELFVPFNASEGLSHPEVLVLFKDSSENMWVGTGDGVNLWLEKQKVFKPFKSSKNQAGSLLGGIIQDIYQAKDGQLWIATQKGLNLYRPATQDFQHFSKNSGLPTTLVRAVADDSQGNLWLTTNKGVSMLNPISGRVENYDSRSGLLGINYYPSSLIKAKNETLFSSSQRGIEFFSTKTEEVQTVDPNVVLTGFSKMGQPVRLEKPYSYISDIYLTHLDYIFSIEFASLDFVMPHKYHYAYKLEGYDDNWIELGNRNTASFTNLDGGDYRLLVRATMVNGEWGKNPLVLNIHVSPPPWKTWWAYGLYITVLLSILFIVIYYRTRLQKAEIVRQKQFVQQLEIQVAEKTSTLQAQTEDLAIALQKAEEATRLKSEFLANMSHEIRTPMNGVLGMLDVLKSGSLSSDQAHAVGIARSSASSLLTLINDILDFSKIEADKLELELVQFDLRTLIEQLTESIAMTAQRKNVEIILDLSELEQDWVYSDPGRVRQILTNLLSNAIKFTEQGEIVITARSSKSTVHDKVVFCCEIKDTGIGIPQEKMTSLFEAFSQVDASTTRKYGGTGLGLSITKRLCQMLNGDVTVSSSLGVGSCFKVMCTFTKGQQQEKLSKQTLEPFKLNVLVVDPSSASRHAIKKQLQVLDISVMEAQNAEHTLHYLNDESARFDFVLCEQQLFDGRSLDLFEMLKLRVSQKNAKLLMMVPLAQHIGADLTEKQGVDGVIAKPITLPNLLRTLANCRGDIADVLGLVNQHNVSAKSDEQQVASPSLTNCRVLLVEDNKINQLVALRLLGNFGLDVEVAENGEQAIHCLIENEASLNPFHLVLMDCQMPILDGYEATKAVRAGNAGVRNKTIPIIAMTANAMQGDREKCLAAGMSDYITKPIDVNSVEAKLKQWLSQDNKI